MFRCELRFTGLGGDMRAAHWARDLAESLQRNGQLVGDSLVGRLADDLVLTGTLPLPDALEPEHASVYVRRGVEALEARSGAPAQVEVEVEPLGAEVWHFERAESARRLLLEPIDHGRVSPLRDPIRELHLPLYRVPISFDQRERVFFWARNARRLDGLWFCGYREVEAYRELACPSSPLMLQGQALAERIEAATGVPTYTWIVRYYGEPERDDERPCPGCGGAWRRPGDKVVPLRCDPCRLASEPSSSTDPEDWAAYRSML